MTLCCENVHYAEFTIWAFLLQVIPNCMAHTANHVEVTILHEPIVLSQPTGDTTELSSYSFPWPPSLSFFLPLLHPWINPSFHHLSASLSGETSLVIPLIWKYKRWDPCDTVCVYVCGWQDLCWCRQMRIPIDWHLITFSVKSWQILSECVYVCVFMCITFTKHVSQGLQTRSGPDHEPISKGLSFVKLTE